MPIKRLFLVSLFIASATIYGQEEVKHERKLKPFFGVKAGFNFLNTKDYDGDSRFSFGYQLGTILNVPISSKFSFQPELFYQAINIKSDYTSVYSNGTVSSESKYKNSYLQLPLLFKYAISKKIDVELGPNVSYLLSGKKTVETTSVLDGVTTTSERTDTYTSTTSRIGFGVNLGTNYSINDQLYAGFRYTLFINEFQTLDSTLDNSVFAFSLGYNFK